MSLAGRINGWRCDDCGVVTYYVHVDDGVTPMFLACRAEGVEPAEAECKGMGTSLMYPGASPPEHVLAAVRWEWYRPEADELDDLRAAASHEPHDEVSAKTIYRLRGTIDHVERGGLLLRLLTDAGRAALRNGAAASGGAQ